MILENLEAYNWRNISGIANWSPDLNLIYGDNGQGKTNWLEAIYLLATTKSFRTQRLQEGIKFENDTASVKGMVSRNQNIKRELQVTLQGAIKTLSVNGKRETTSAYLGQLHAYAFTANELDTIHGAPEARRRFIDRGIVSLQQTYVHTLADYNRVIKQKNRLLQEASDASEAVSKIKQQIEVWNFQLVKLGATIHHARAEYVKKLNEKLRRDLFGTERYVIRYVSALEGKGDLDDYEKLFAERLEVRLQAEINAGYSLIGPHRDDLEITLDSRSLRIYGSSGQHRSALILLDLAAIDVYYDWHQEYPLFVMDDVDAELDARRLSLLLKQLEGRTQTFITTSDEELRHKYAGRARAYRIIAGCIEV